jgi:class 3 adenylate cyclase/tetratricopeptide (TPR) repeat protein
VERRLVTVLFADLVGSTTMAEGADVEAVRELLGRYYDLCRDVVGRYGGTIEKFIGDAVMAVWGTPTAHEDDAERAVRAALDLVDAAQSLRTPAGQPLRVRAGVLTGEAAVNLGAEGQSMVAGDLVNTASRLQGAAPAGAVLVGEATMRGSQASIDFEPVGEQIVAGKSVPVAAWQAIRVSAMRMGTGRSTRLEPPFVGRDDEMRLLKEVFLQTARERRARLVSVTGIAGIGKSRLAWELQKYIDGLVDDIYWHQGRSPAYGDGLAFWALGEMVRHRARIAETDDAATAREKLAAMTAEYLPDAAERARVEPRLATLLGLEGAAAGSAEELTAAWRTLFERIADRGPTILVFEDLHWADAGLLDFIEALLASARNKPILVLALARPELMESRPTWGAAVRNHLRLDLAPLDDASMEMLLLGLAPGIPPEAITTIRARAEGIPLYAVETVRMLLDQGRLTETDGRFRLVGDLAGLAVPDSLMALLGSRLDALDADTRDLVGHCAVLGISFTVESVAALAGRPVDVVRRVLDGLVARELFAFEDDPRSPERGQYRFLQGVLREVAYGRLSRRERQVRHVAAAEAFAAQNADELAGVVASHYLEAVRAAGEVDREALRVRALAALEAAAARSRAIGAHAGAAGYLADAVDLAADDDERLRLREARLDALYVANALPEVKAEGAALAVIGRERGDLALLARAVFASAGALLSSGSPTDAVAALDSVRTELGAFAESNPDGVRVIAELGRSLLMAGEPSRAASVIDEALPIAERLGLREVVAELLASKGWALAAQGRVLEGAALLRGAVTFAERGGWLRAEFRARMNFSAWSGWEDAPEAVEIAKVGMERAQLAGRDAWALTLGGNAFSGAIGLGQWDWVVDAVSRFGFDDRPEPWAQMPATAYAFVLAYRGEARRAQEVANRIAEAIGDADDPQLRTAVFSLRQELAFARGDLEAAAAAYEQGIAIVANLGWDDTLAIAPVMLERRDLAGARAAAKGARGGYLRDIALDAVAACADVLAGDLTRLPDVDAGIEILESGGLRFFAAEFSRARAMLAPDAPGARAAAARAVAIFRELGAVTMLRGLHDLLDVSDVPQAEASATPVADPAQR